MWNSSCQSEFQNIETLNPGNPKTIPPGSQATARINVGESDDQLNTADFKLHLQFRDVEEPSNLSVKLNGRAIKFLGTDGRWLTAGVAGKTLRSGENRVDISLPPSAGKVIWTDLLIKKRSVAVQP